MPKAAPWRYAPLQDADIDSEFDLDAAATRKSHARRYWQAVLAITFATVLGVSVLLAASASARKPPSAAACEHCYATKTPYWDQRRADALISPAPLPTARRLLQTQLVVRHGTRYPTREAHFEMALLVAKLAPFDYKLPTWLRGYELPYNASVLGLLAEPGKRELAAYARRRLQALAWNSTQDYSNSTYMIEHTHVTRTMTSARAFATAFFANPQDVHYIEHRKGHDRELRFFEICPYYRHHIKQNESTLAERQRFRNATLVQRGIARLQQKLNLDPMRDTNITAHDLATVFSACAFDRALFNETEQWCSLLDEDMLHIMDFDTDLTEFYHLGGGFPINYEMSAVLLQALVHTMERRINGSSEIVGAFRFAHAETVLPLFTLLGFGARTPLLATESRHEIETRGFRSSALSPFAANLELRLFEGTTKSKSKNGSKLHYVQVLLNEREDIVLDGCDQVLCEFEQVKRIWARYLDGAFDFDEACRD